VRTAFDDFSLLQDDDIISAFDGLKAVSDDNDRSPRKESFKGFCNLLLAIAIECCSWFIEKDNLRIFEKYFCDSETLLLSATETNPSFTNLSLETIFEFINKLTLCELYCFCDFLFCFSIPFDFFMGRIISCQQ